MAYDARKKEVLAQFEKFGFAPAKKEMMDRVFEKYFADREARLQKLLLLLKPGAEPCAVKWVEQCREAAAAALQILEGVDFGKHLFAKLADDEQVFFRILMRSAIPVKRDLMVQQTRDLAKAEREFEEKWATIKSGDKTVDERMQKVAQEYDEIFRDAAAFAAKQALTAKEAFVAGLKTVMFAGFSAIDLGITEKIIQGAALALGVKISEVEARRLEIHSLISREEHVYATFKEARGIVKKFLEETSYPRVKSAYEEAERATDAFANELYFNGQKADALEYAIAIKRELAPVFSVAEEAYKSFAKKHEFLFFGPLGGGYYQELYEDETWKNFSKSWQDKRRDLDNLLRDRFFEVGEAQVLEVSLDGISPGDKILITGRLRASLQELLAAWNRFKSTTNDPYWALQSREVLKSVLEAMRSG